MKFLSHLLILVILVYFPFNIFASHTTNLISYWNLNEASGTATDSLAVNNLTDNNTVARVSGKINNAGDFERANSEYFSKTDASQTGLDFSDALTFAGWVNFETVDGEDHFIVKRLGTGNQRSYDFRMSGASTLLIQTFHDGLNAGCNTGVTWSPSTATWYHVAVTKSGTTVKYYVNGAQQGTDQSCSNGTIYNGTARFVHGADADGGEYMDGLLDEWGVWSRALTASEISCLYNSGTGITYPFTACDTAPSSPRNGVVIHFD